ncbi:hypothetical protein LSH36_1239g00030 [Paralvinella palmiformis]|uniref:C-type lectin domain-containing protein n=1 Tax=Paralvinella palmiformis TaxID=53620 RepID=A0AAD9IUH1_9ANNE|nr:hypothetical protein LSH36_1239g00030 [Paralvinella palmiformis]
MFVEYIFIILGCCVLSSDCHYKTICEGSSCYFLYENKTSFLTWDQSHRACNTEGLEMLGIESRQIQTVIEGLVNNLPRNTARQIWIGGRRSTDDKWRYLNGTQFNKQYTRNNESAQYCLYVKLCKNGNPEYHADNCDEKNSNSRLLCQFDQSKTDRCNSSDSHFGDKCYRKTTHDGQKQTE